ncbi:hypothetical protein, partial [Bradyrhizobium sp.]|uniref:hypothetical protein n=1 Tax=Bradyrhizobium sp. TaxID=376 RepID=UPI003C1C0A4A
MRLASYVPGELIPLPLSGSIPELPHVAEVGCTDGCAAVIWLRSPGFDLPALTLSTQLRRYAVRWTRYGGGRATRDASRRR